MRDFHAVTSHESTPPPLPQTLRMEIHADRAPDTRDAFAPPQARTRQDQDWEDPERWDGMS
jgi:hypothetical protein